MADYRLEGWESRDLVEVAVLVQQLVAKLPEVTSRGCLSAGFDDWETAAHLGRTPHWARYSASFTGDALTTDALEIDPPSALGDVDIDDGATRVTLMREPSYPWHGFRGEAETVSTLAVSRMAPRGDHHHPFDPVIIDRLADLGESLGIEPNPMKPDTRGIHCSSSHGFPEKGDVCQSYHLANIPLDAALRALRVGCEQTAEAPARIQWEMIGSRELVGRAVESMPAGVTALNATSISPLSDDARMGRFGLERGAWSRPTANFEIAQMHELAAGIASLSERLLYPKLYVGPVVWPSRRVAPLPIKGNYVSISRRKGEWQPHVGIWREYDEDPTVQSVRKELEPLINSIRPGVLKKIGLFQISPD